MKVIYLIVFLLLIGCTPTRHLSVDETLTFPINILPDGWAQHSTQKEPEWGTQNAFLTQYSHQVSYLNLIYWFIYYDNINLASEFLNNYEEGVFFVDIQHNNQWQYLSNRFILDTQNYDKYDLRCTDIVKNGISLQQCAVHLQYNHCNIILSSNVDDEDIALQDIVNILNYVDSKMPQVDTCNS